MIWRYFILMFLCFPFYSFAHDIPVIGQISPDQSRVVDEAFSFFAENVTDTDCIARVWAIVPQSNHTSQIITMKQVNLHSHRYECQIDGFGTPGIYEISIIAMDWTGTQSLPKTLTVTVLKRSQKRAAIITGGRSGDPLWSSIRDSIMLSWHALVARGYFIENITLFSAESIPGIDKQTIPPLDRYLRNYFHNLNSKNTEDIVVYLIGETPFSGFRLNQTDILMANDLDQWMDNCQNQGIQDIWVVSDFSGAEQFNAQLMPPVNQQRMLIASASDNEIALAFGHSGFVFSNLFWNHVLHNGNVGHAWKQVQKILSWELFRQTPCMDSNADGKPNESIDLELMFHKHIGHDENASSHIPAINAHQCQPDGTILAEFTPSGSAKVSLVQAIIFPPEFYQQIENFSVQILDSMALVKNDNQYMGTYPTMTKNGVYQVYLYATSHHGVVSDLYACQFQNVDVLPDAYENDNSPQDASLIQLSWYRSDEFISHPQWHNFHTKGDTDWIKFNAQSGVQYVIEVKDVAQNADPMIELYETDGKTPLYDPVDINFNGQGEYVEWQCHRTGMYYARICQCDPTTVEGCSSAYGTMTEYKILFYPPVLNFFGLMWGKIDPPDANATIQSIRNKVYQLSNGYYFLVDIAGKVTLEITANGFETLVDEFNILECIDLSHPEDKNRVDIVLHPVPTRPVAEFSGTPVQGIAPLTVSFHNTSKSGDQWHWHFGDNTESIEKNPIHIYEQPGIYSVELIVINSLGKDIRKRNKYIHVAYPSPKADFKASGTSGTPPLEVKFFDLSTGIIHSWYWDFGDGTVSSERNPVHTYQEPGRQYPVALTVQGPGGKHTKSVSNYIHVGDFPPIVSFRMVPNDGVAPLKVQFHDQSQGKITQTNWFIDTDHFSQSMNPEHTFLTPGTYDIVLKVEGPGGQAEKKACLTVNWPPPIADFIASPTSGDSPLAVQFEDKSSGNVSQWLWDFGDNQTSHEQHPEHVYQTSKSYSVQLTVAGPGGQNSKKRINYIAVNQPLPPLIASFSASPRTGTAPLDVIFSDESTGRITQWLWDFGDGSFGYQPVVTHTYLQPGVYSVRLTVSNNKQTDTHTIKDDIQVAWPKPTAQFSLTASAGNFPLTVHFINESTGNINRYVWSFGDGQTDTAENPFHIYETPGDYTVMLTAFGPGGVDTFRQRNAVTVTWPQPEANFSVIPDTGVAPLTVKMIDRSVCLMDGQITSWQWIFGDGGTAFKQDCAYTYALPGQYYITLVVSGPGGTDSKTIHHAVTVNHPLPEPDFSAHPTTGNAPQSIQFTDHSTGSISHWLWNFGDGQTSHEHHPTHIFETPGQYTISLTTTGPGGTNIIQRERYIDIQWGVPVAQFTASPTIGIAPLTVAFRDQSTGMIQNWLWKFGDETPQSDPANDISRRQQHPVHIYTKPGLYSVSLTVSNPGNKRTEKKNALITVQSPPPPEADFYGEPTKGMAPLTVCFHEILSQDVDEWIWAFGDGSIQSIQAPCHEYSLPGIYTVKLEVRGSGGTNQIIHDNYIEVTQPLELSADFYANVIHGIAPLEVQFFNTTSDQTADMQWFFGDHAQSQEISPTHIYTQAGQYTVRLIATTDQGSDEKIRMYYIDVIPPKPLANFSCTPTTGTAPLTVYFKDRSINNITQWLWDFGDGNAIDRQHPNHTYDNAGNYRVSLTVKGPGGLDSLDTIKVMVYSPIIADFSVSYDNLTAPAQVAFINQSSGEIDHYSWDFGDGTGSHQKHPQKTYDRPGEYWVTLNVQGPNGTDSFTFPRALEIVSPSHLQFYQLVQQIPADSSSESVHFPLGMTQNADQQLIIADYGNDRIQQYDMNQRIDNFLSTTMMQGPSGICMDNAGHVYVTDTGNHGIKVFDDRGGLLYQWGRYGSDAAQFNFPLSLAVDQNHHVFVADTNNHRIQKFTNTGEFLTQWGQWGNGIGEMDHPSGIAVDEQTVYVSDSGNERILVFTSSGHYQNQWPASFQFPYHVSTDQYGCVYVSDVWEQCVYKYNMNGHMLARIHMNDFKNDGISFPTHLYVNDQGQLFVSDTQQDLINIFQTIDKNLTFHERLRHIIELLQILADVPNGWDHLAYDWNQDGRVGLRDVLFLMRE
jgi:PKD repeat protein/sugar lactone lactonase YvrE